MGRHFLAALVLLGLALLIIAPAQSTSAPAAPAGEYQIKAAFLYNFAKFVEWPANKFSTTNSPVVIGVLGRDPFGADLDKTILDETVGGRPIVIKRFDRMEDIQGCHILFVSPAEKGRLVEIVREAEKASVLTVSETDNFAESGGIINFTKAGNKVRLEMNVNAARRSDLKISAKLLSLAHIVQEGEK
jgi:hypothetical protein